MTLRHHPLPSETTPADPVLAEIAAELPPLMRSEAAAELLGISVRTLRNRHHLRLPPKAMKVSRRLLYPRSELIAYLARG